MRKIYLISLVFCTIILTDSLVGQPTVYHPTFTRKAVYFDITPPLRDMKMIQILKEKDGLEK